ncbi:GntR family transcriptional regulator [Roseburia sp. 1XD42-69]|uniref:GntR family transcriptional regulator n=1 Tax=Roseburia sp. 1XD42-69 TaxID=2320088 RepID=UPI000EA22ACB|nr:GntR family transcriptional regulator [Roseburia sp. 1XD42-69]RKJ61312.1 GntR family transcriptional regulator [Roseburia sp. 1XD42-69]
MNKRYKYQEIAERIKMDIFVNYQAPNKSIPSIREYAEGNQGNPHTVACALRLLMEKGIIYANKRKGYCVAIDIKDVRKKLVDEAKKELLCKLSQLGYKKEEIAMLIRHFLEDY